MTDAIAPVGASPLPEVHRERVARNVLQSKSPNTIRAYRSGLVAFAGWCEGVGRQSLPATPDTVAAYISDEAEQGRKPSTLGQRLAAIRYAHVLNKLADPTGDALVRETLKGIRREKGVKPTQKEPITVDRLAAMLAHVDRETMGGKRDAALLLFGFMSAMRRSELAALEISDLELTPNGLLVTVRRSKTDQEGQGDEIGVPLGHRKERCPVRAIGEWVEATGIQSGPLFRCVNRHGHVGEAISGGAIDLAVKRLAKRAGLKSADFGGHSLRRGFVTSAAEAGKSTAAIMAQGRWKTSAMVNVYTGRVDLWKGHAGDGLL